MQFKQILKGAAALAMLATSWSAQAADIPRPVYKGSPVRHVVAYYNWTGFYAGINGGYGWGRSDWDFAALNMKPKGGMVGGTLGYNYQIGSMVWGLEGDFDWANMKNSVACGPFECKTESRWLATFRGRLGYAVDRFLPYFTAGGAYGDVKVSTDAPGIPGASKSKLGWTVGGGVEYAFLGNWTAKLEYLYVDLGKFDCGLSCGPVAPGTTNNVDFNEHIVRVGVNYKFSGPVFSRW